MKRRTFLGMAAGVAAFSGAVAGGAGIFLHRPAFGAVPEETPAFLRSPHYRDGVFHNTLPTPLITDGSTFAGAVIRSFFARRDRPIPPAPLPTVRVDPGALDRSRDLVVWFGHSSFLVQMGGFRFLLDPVFSPYASPFSFSNRAFPGTTPCAVADIPPVDCVLISHDHWDHLDYPTIMALKDRIALVVCPLGVGAHFRHWGFPAQAIREGDWGEALDLGRGVRVHVTESRHYSGRTLIRDRTLWGGFLVEAGGRTLYYSGDGGYGPHFAAMGKAFGGVDFALLDCGQYNIRWCHTHMMPEEAVRAAEDLGARAVIPAHVGKFALARHPWDEPFRRMVAASRGRSFRLLTPRIGEPVDISGSLPTFSRWWETVPGGAAGTVAG